MRERVQEERATRITLPTARFFCSPICAISATPSIRSRCSIATQRRALETVLAEVNNTFGERKNYWITSPKKFAAPRKCTFRHSTNGARLRVRADRPGETLIAHMNTLDNGGIFSTRRYRFNGKNGRRSRWDCHAAISLDDGQGHWRDPLGSPALYLKKAPVYKHP